MKRLLILFLLASSVMAADEWPDLAPLPLFSPAQVVHTAAMLDLVNTFTAANTFTATSTFTGDALFKSGRPWYDVMAFGAKNDGATDDTAAIAAAIAAANANGGGVVYFPAALTAGTHYYRVTSTCAASPFVITAPSVELRGNSSFGYNSSPNLVSQIFAPNCNGDLISTSGAINGVQIDHLQIVGSCQVSPCAGTPNGRAINLSGALSSKIWDNTISFWGLSAVFSSSGTEVVLEDNWIFACVYSRPSVDTGCVDLNSTDNVAFGNFVSASTPTTAGNIGNGHSYAWAIRAGGGFYHDNYSELSQHGWLITGTFNRFANNRSILHQGNGFVITGTDNTFTGNMAWADSQNANGSFDGFVVSGQNNTFTNNYCSNSGGNGNIIRHCFNDSNSSGTGQANENQYSNNRANSNGMTGVLYNMTGTAPYRIEHPEETSGDRGDTSPTIQCWIDASVQYFNTSLTANRTVTLSTTGAWNGCKFRVFRSASATGVFTLTVNGVALQAGQYVDSEFIAGAWKTFAAVPGVSVGSFVTSQKAETGAADANVLTATPIAAAGTYRACFTASVSSATAGVIGWTLSFTDSNGNAQANIAQSLFQGGTAAPALTFTTSAAGNYQSCSQFDINNAAASIIVKWVGGGTTAAKVSATVERLI